MPDGIGLFVNGRATVAPAGTNVAAAITGAGETVCRMSVHGEPRGPLCGMGICFECRVTIDGLPHQRSCQMPCRDGMRIETRSGSSPSDSVFEGKHEEKSFDVLVVGAGPAGLAAAACAAKSGCKVGLLDDNPNIGGQIWRNDTSHEPAGPAADWIKAIRQSSVTVLTGSQVVGQTAPGKLLTEMPNGETCEVSYGKLILASGARERFLPFPGWTLPNVMGAGGLQALVKGGLPIQGKRVAIAGTGPLLLAVAAYLCKRGANISLVAEQAPLGKLIGFGLGLLFSPAKLWEGAKLRRQFRGVPYRTGCWPVAAEGNERLERITFRAGTKTWSEPCDYLACGFGLIPNTELAALLGCAIEQGHVAVNERQATSVTNIYCAGEATGIGGLDKALVEGQIAGFAATDQRQQAGDLFSKRTRALRFARNLEKAFALRDELKSLATDDTIVCRCEDVRFGKLKSYRNSRDAKLQTRCGMGPCQGRVCGTALEYLLGWNAGSVRPPVFPAKVAALAE